MSTAKQKTAQGLSILAGLLYSSWPLGYLLNPKVAHASLASGLEAVHQPYNWLFVGADILSSLLMLVVCSILWGMYPRGRFSGLVRVGLVCTALFGLGTMIDALLPERCVPNLMACPSFRQDHALLIHGLFSILASVALFGALLALWLHRRSDRLLTALMTAYVIFGAMSLVQAVTSSLRGNWSQDYYISLCSLWLMFLPARAMAGALGAGSGRARLGRAV